MKGPAMSDQRPAAASTRSLIDDIDLDEESWLPRDLGPGATLKGEIRSVSTFEGDYGPSPVLVVLTDDGRLVRWIAFGAVPQNELTAQNPQVGDRIGVRFLGRAEGKSYDSYRIVVEHRAAVVLEPQPQPELFDRDESF
jgi:hypothetical protein